MNNASTERELDHFVYKNIVRCQTGLVEMLLNKGTEDTEIAEIGFEWEHITNYYEQDENGQPSENGEYPQIFEWWLLENDYIAELLEKENECILKTDNGIYWGRTCSGQAISMDSVIETIYQKTIF